MTTNRALKAFVIILPRTFEIYKKNDFLKTTYNVDSIDGPQVCIDVSIYDDENGQDWCTIGDTNPLGEYIRSLPCCLFYGKKDGDEIEISINNKKLILILQPYNNVKFEKTFYLLSSSFGGFSSQLKGLTDKEKLDLFITNHVNIAKALNLEIVKKEKFKYYENILHLFK